MKIQKHVLTFPYKSRLISFSVYSTSSLREIKSILLLGTVQTGSTPRSVAKFMQAGTAVVQGAPHWFASKDGIDIPEFVFGYTKHAVKSILTKTKNKKVHIIADSQAVPGAINFAKNHASSVSQLSLLQPLGLNRSAFPGNISERVGTLRKRIISNFRYQVPTLLSDLDVPRNHIKIAGITLRDTLRGSAANQYGTGLAYDSSDELRQVSESIPVYIIAGENDAIFPPAEIVATLREAAINNTHLTVIPNIPHSPLSSRAGRKLLNALTKARK